MFSTTKHGHEKGKGNQPRMNTEQPPLRISRMARMGEGRGGAPMDTDGGLVVARRVEPGAVRRFEPPGSPRRATAGKRPKNGPIFRKIPVFRPNLSRLGVKSRFFIETCRAEARNGPKTAFSDSFSPARPVAVRFRSENRLTPRRQDAKELLSCRTPLGALCAFA